MLEFHTPTPADRAWVDSLFYPSGNRGCEFSFTNLFCWQSAYPQQITRINDYCVIRLESCIGSCYVFPGGTGELKPVIDLLMEDAARRKKPFKLICVTPEQMELLEQLYPGQFTCTEDRSGFDYLYEIDKLAVLPGKKLHGKRNHIRRFLDSNPDWAVEEISEENISECLTMDREWYRLNRGWGDRQEEESLDNEGKALRLAIRNFTPLGLEGILLRSGGNVIAFTMGRPICADTYDINFEKAFSHIQGAYPMINREFARWIRDKHPSIRYLNREDDMGVEGLRKAKLSYYPDRMVEKHTAIFI